MKTILVIIAILLVGWGIYAFVGKDEQIPTPNENTNTATSTSSTSTSTSSTSASTTDTSTATVKTFTVIGKPYSFTPTKIEVNKGDRVKIVFQNQQGTHDWVIDEFNARTKILQGGQTETIEFVADKSGSFEYYCSVGTHRQMGMKGTLTVK